MRELVATGWGAKRFGRERGLGRNTVRRYLRGGRGAEVQERPTVHFLVAVQSYSRRIFVKALLHERQGEWLDGIAYEKGSMLITTNQVVT